jgi:hypothetical protein
MLAVAEQSFFVAPEHLDYLVLRQFHCDFFLAAGQSSDSIFPA